MPLNNFGTRKAEVLNSLSRKSRPMKTISTTYYKCFDNSSYHHQCIANWTAVIMLEVLIGHSGEKRCEKMENAKGCFGSDEVAWSIRNHMSQLDTRRWWWRVTSWVRHGALVTSEKCTEASTGCLHSALVCVLESTKIQESAAVANCCQCQWPRVCEVNAMIWIGLQVSAYWRAWWRSMLFYTIY